ncbi:MAG: bifunctional UDP-N-acetylglucosamine diphosphorylase/glucosamine-1-phosphate N-acetyltransferase GlmU, partial [Parvularculaceae bacterium]
MSGKVIAAVILAAGQGVRMKSDLAKVLHPVGGRAMLAHAIDAAAKMTPARLVVVIGERAEVGDAARKIRPDISIAVQAPPRGTGDAVAKALPALDGLNGVVLILYADTPLVEVETLGALAEAAKGAAGAVLGFRTLDPGGYGRLVLDAKGALVKIVEAKEATAEELEIELCNSGVMAVDADFLRESVPRLTPDNAKREYYLTDIIGMAKAAGKKFAVVEGDEDEVIGVNSRLELAVAEEIFQDRRRIAAMEDGATLIDPSTVYFSWDTKIGRDIVVEPNVFIGPGVMIADGARVRAFSHIEGATIGTGAIVGPFARLRPGAVLQKDAHIGNFVEVKNAVIGEGAKANHLSYIGDASVGARANIGAGAITCNYDGVNKHKTEIGEGAFIGSN